MTRQEYDAGIRAGLEALKFEGIDELMGEVAALPFDDDYLGAVIARLTDILNARVRTIQAEAETWAAIADEAKRQAATFAIEFERFRQLAVSSTVN